MSPREKKLLLLLCLIVVSLSSFMILILPRLEFNKNLRDDFHRIEDQVIEMDAIINHAPLVKKDLEDLSKKLDGDFDLIADPPVSDYTIKKLKGFAKTTGLDIHEIHVEEERADFVEVSYPELNPGHYELYNEILTYNQSKSKSLENLYSEYEIPLQSLSIRFDGGSSQVSSFIHQIYAGQKTVFIKSLNYDYVSQKGSMDLELYTLEKPQKG